jgi:serine phosphatase RsbU (regulator of sigma subunit)
VSSRLVGDPLPEPDYALLFASAPVPLVLVRPDLRVVDANREWLATAGIRLEAAVGRTVFDVLPAEPDGVEAAVRASLERAREMRRPDERTVRRPGGPGPAAEGSSARRAWTVRTVPVLDEKGEVVLLLHRAEEVGDLSADLDERSRAAQRSRAAWVRQVESALHARTRELEAANAELRALSERERRSARSLAGLATAVSALAAAENRGDLLRHLFRHGGAAFDADALAVALLQAGGGSLTVVDDRSPEEGPLGRPLDLDSPLAIAVAAAGRPVFQPDAADAEGSAPPLPGLRSWAALPLHAGRRPLGSLTIGWRRPRPLGEDDVRVLEAFAAQCAEAVDRVARLESERRKAAATRSLAEVLQRSLLTDPPRSERLDIAVRYRPAAREVQIGGDWYDAFLSPGGAVTVAVGDVTGHDRTAAAVAGQLRNMLRGIVCALDGGDPAEVLGTLDRALRDTGGSALATAVVARIERGGPAEDASTFTWSNAGHPPPLLIQPDGAATLLERPSDLLLGVDPGVARQRGSVLLRPGATVVFYTDGLIEHRDATLDDGLARLLATAPDLAARPVSEVCDQLLSRLEPELTDDIALLVLRLREEC